MRARALLGAANYTITQIAIYVPRLSRADPDASGRASAPRRLSAPAITRISRVIRNRPIYRSIAYREHVLSFLLSLALALALALALFVIH